VGCYDVPCDSTTDREALKKRLKDYMDKKDGDSREKKSNDEDE
jgi:hypothetical protein